MCHHMSCVDDDNRVVLKPVNQYDSDYVNASYVDVSHSHHQLSRVYSLCDVYGHSLLRVTPCPGSSLPHKVHIHEQLRT